MKHLKRVDRLDKFKDYGFYELPKIKCIYCLRFSNNKVYIGSTVNFLHRIQSHICYLRNNYHCNEYIQRSYNKYGKPKVYLLKIIKDEDIGRRYEFEDYYINYFKSSNSKFGYNFGTAEFPSSDLRLTKIRAAKNKGRKKTKEEVEKIRNTLIGRKRSPEVIEKCRIGVIKAWKERGDIIKAKMLESRKWYSPTLETREKLSKINKNDPWRKEHLAKLVEDRRNREDSQAEKLAAQNLKQYALNHMIRKIGQFSKESNILIREYISLSEASRETGFDFRNLSAACLGKQKTAYGYIWKYLTDKPENINTAYSKESRKTMARANKSKISIIQYDLGGDVICEHQSISDAAKSVGGSRSSISSCCNGKVKKAYNSIWKYKND